jgi:hypothetical protein
MIHVYISCEIDRGAFANERSFEIKLSDKIKLSTGASQGILVGTAHRMHLLDGGKHPLGEDEPGYGDKISGFVQCEKIRDLENGCVLVEVPSADLIHVPKDELVTV